MGITDFLGEESDDEEGEDDAPPSREDPDAIIRSIESQLLELRRALAGG